jgi:hypothetical protein
MKRNPPPVQFMPGYPFMAGPPGQPQKGQHGTPFVQSPLGQPLDRFGILNDPRFADFEKIAAWYTISIELGGDSGSNQRGAVQLRPEPFLCFRITWATTGDTFGILSFPPFSSPQGRAVEILWGDEFTKFMGDQPALLSSVFGDSEGFLDIPHGLQFEGKQSLSASLTRLFWPDPDTDPVTTRFDIVFAGVGLLPLGTHQSGSPR